MVNAKRSAAGKKAWARKSASEKAKVVSRLRRASGRSGGTKALSRSSNPSGGSSPARSGNGGQRIGAATLAAKRFVVFLAPVTDEVILASQTKQGLDTSLNNLRNKANLDYAINLGVMTADAWLDKKTGQAAALSRGSVTAWAGEAYLALKSANQARTDTNPRKLHADAVRRHQGYDPWSKTFLKDDPEFREYRIIHHVGQGVRMVGNRTRIGKALAAPLKKGLAAIGAGL